MASSIRADQYPTLFRAALGQSARDSESLLREVFHAALRSLEEEFARSSDESEREHLRISHKTLGHEAAALCAQFPAVLLKGFQSKPEINTQFGELALGELKHEQLEQMNETEVQERIEMVRALHFVQPVVRDSLNELNALISALLGFDHVRPQRNPLRPQVYLKMLHLLMVDSGVPTRIRTTWCKHMALALGRALEGSYALLARKIKSYGVVSLPMSSTGESNSRDPGVLAEQFAGQKTSTDESSDQPNALTLDRLHELLAGHLAEPIRVPPDQAEAQFAGVWTQGAGRPAEVSPDHSDSLATDFVTTIPAAFEALQNLSQVELSFVPLHSLTGSACKLAPVRQMFRSRCQSSDQVLSLDVMCKMIDSLVQDTRLPEPVRGVIEKLEPALFQMVLSDVLFFKNKNHPARLLLQEITQRGMAFHSVDEPGFALFIRSLHRYVYPLSRMPVDSSEPFAQALVNLKKMWSEQSVAFSQTMEQAMQVLVRAEERNLLAEKMNAALKQIPDMHRVPRVVADFLCGPWAQVMAFAELNNTEKSEDPQGYKSLVNILLWSVQPDLTRRNLARLSKGVARLLSKLREGLALIDYPLSTTSSFFDELMRLHQQAFQPTSVGAERQTASPNEKLLRNHQHWVAPAEAQTSGFMEMPQEEAAHLPVPQRTEVSSRPVLDFLTPIANPLNLTQTTVDIEQLVVGAWVEIDVNGVWQRSQLRWISPQKSMYLFANAYGTNQSMTRNSLEKLLATKALQLLSDQSVVDGALDSVVQAAMLNSLDIRP
jgi:Protein of unknown function (DUF1631)